MTRPSTEADPRTVAGPRSGVRPSPSPAVTAAALSSRANALLDGGTAAMESRPADGRDEGVARLRA